MAETLFDGGRRRATSTAARANYDATVANYRESTLTAFSAGGGQSGRPAYPRPGSAAAKGSDGLRGRITTDLHESLIGEEGILIYRFLRHRRPLFKMNETMSTS